MRIIIDLQGAQSNSRHRGIGRYSLALAQAMVRNRGSHEIFIVLNGLFPETIEPIRFIFDDLIPQENIKVWFAPEPVNSLDPANTWRRNTAELIRESYLQSLQPDIVHITSLFEGFHDNSIHSINKISKNITTAVTFYDVIPLIQSDIYLAPEPAYEQRYLEKLSYLKQASIYLAISESARQETIDYLGATEEQTVNIGSAVDDKFEKILITKKDEALLRQRFKLDRPFLMYSGATDERKNHLRLIKAYSLLPNGLRAKYQLAIVGGLPDAHRIKFETYAKFCGLTDQDLIITGRVTDSELIQLYNLTHLFVFPSWHEGFGLPALEAMSCGAPVIGASNTSLPEVIGRTDALFDPFSEQAICQKIVDVLADENFRTDLAMHSLQQSKKFSWDESAKRALAAFEILKKNPATKSEDNNSLDLLVTSKLIKSIASVGNASKSELDWISTAQCISQNLPASQEKRILVDISELVQRDARTGIQRVVRSVLTELVEHPPAGFKIEFVYAVHQEHGYRYARNFSQGFFKRGYDFEHVDEIQDDFIDVFSGDIFLGLDLNHHVVSSQSYFFTHMRLVGVKVYFVIYDLLPVLMPEVFPDGSGLNHGKWLEMLAQNDGVLCISQAVADEFKEWLTVFGPKRLRPLKIGFFHLGADVSKSSPTRGMPSNAVAVMDKLRSRRTFLSVGTIEPRKGQLQTLAAFDILWSRGTDVNLVFIGKTGWNVELLVELLRNHKEKNNRLFWLESISDEYLQNVYSVSSCLIAASQGEGFGLPLIEAAQYEVPILARDIPVFREVAGPNALYFSGLLPETLAAAVQNWIGLDSVRKSPQSKDMPWLTWKESTTALLNVILQDSWYTSWLPDGVRRFWGSDSRLGTQVGKRVGQRVCSTDKAGYLIFGPYVPLEKGNYLVSITGNFLNNNDSPICIDCVADQARVKLGELLLKSKINIEQTIDLQLEIDKGYSDVEIRVFTDGFDTISISLLQIREV